MQKIFIKFSIQEDEYGVHWNFFFTLFFLRVNWQFSNLHVLNRQAFVALMPSRMLIPIGFCIGLTYEFVLQFLGFEEWMLQKMPRNNANWLVQNREGFFSMFGYCFIYALSLAYARWHYRLMKMGKRWNLLLFLFSPLAGTIFPLDSSSLSAACFGKFCCTQCSACGHPDALPTCPIPSAQYFLKSSFFYFFHISSWPCSRPASLAFGLSKNWCQCQHQGRIALCTHLAATACSTFSWPTCSLL